MRKMVRFTNFEDYGTWRFNVATNAAVSRAMRQRADQARANYQASSVDRLSAEPRGNEVDLRRKR